MTVPDSLIFFRGQPAFFRSRGVEFVFVTSPGPKLESFAATENVEVHRVPMRREIAPLRDLVSLIRLIRLIRRLRPDVVHSHTPKGGLLGMLAARLVGVPLRIYHVRGLRLDTARGAQRAVLWAAERLACALAHRVICVSSSVRERMLVERLCSPRRMTVLAHGSGSGVDMDVFHPQRAAALRTGARRRWGIPDDAIVIGFVGRLVRDKGIIELELAWRQLRTEFRGLHLLVVGKVEPQDPLPEPILPRLASDPRVHLTGEIDQVIACYAAMDVLVLPTYREGFATVLLEAGALELPVVATQVTGCIDAVEDGVTGMLVPAHDAERLAKAVATYVRDAHLRAEHGQAGRRHVAQFFQSTTVWEALYAEYVGLIGRLPARA